MQQLLAAHFNQDWVDDHKSANDVIDFFISEADSDIITKVQIEIDKLITSKKTEQELKDFLFEKIVCYYYYSNEWKDGRTWLRHVASTLTHSQSSKNVPLPQRGFTTILTNLT
ncbi:contact-dependent growth inhibition system immunity protein [Pseudomonas marginalis]|uniref:contact-dependent growth inhibition system immunity protein n=1 Tax=Pseudomonas marginalis TaxID=298 RepID=UPI0020342B77|nr:contact-dependent growth inhibition system immunity protein [Pseudomonas marginalis]MCM2377260.1 contact-dependent growth inhibition system immunity protein [Pseudomonas marginalis]